MEDFQEGEFSNHNYQRALIELQKFDDPNYLIMFWRAVGNWWSPDIPSPEICKPWTKGIEKLTK